MRPGSRLDDHLESLLEYLLNRPDAQKTASAAAIVDGDMVTREVARHHDDGIVHAPRSAMDSHCAAYGAPSADAWVITTLPPCVDPDPRRKRGSCADLLRGNDSAYDTAVPKFHTGYMPARQGDGPTYAEMEMTVSRTNDERLKACCENLSQFFREENPESIDVPTFVDEALSPLK